jgi:hypothetical protein
LLVANDLQSTDLAALDADLLDVDGDGWITAADFTAVATHLNLATAEPQSVQSASEGEPVSAEYCEQNKEYWVDFYSAALAEAIATGADQ